MKYTPPDVPDELYGFLKPADSLMLRGLVAKFNGLASNCVRVTLDRPEPTPSVEEIFQKNLHNRLKSSPPTVVVRPLEIEPNPESPRFQDPIFQRETESTPLDTYLNQGVRPEQNDDRDDLRANHPAPSASDNIYTLVVKTILRDGPHNMNQLITKISLIKPTTKGSVAAAVWRLSKQQSVLVKVPNGSRTPTYDLTGAGLETALNNYR